MSTHAPDKTQEETNKQIVAEFMEVFSTGDQDRYLAMMGDSATWWVGGSIEGISGTYNKEEFRTMSGGLAEICKGGAIGLKPVAWAAEGDRVAVETESYAELNNGRVYNNLYHFVFIVRDGKIHQIKEFLDTEHTRAVFLGSDEEYNEHLESRA